MPGMFVLSCYDSMCLPYIPQDDDPVVGDTVGAMANLTVQPPQSSEFNIPL